MNLHAQCSNKRLDLLVNVCLKEAWVRITHSRRVRNICSGEHLVFTFPLEGHYNAYIKWITRWRIKPYVPCKEVFIYLIRSKPTNMYIWNLYKYNVTCFTLDTDCLYSFHQLVQYFPPNDYIVFDWSSQHVICNKTHTPLHTINTLNHGLSLT